MPSGKVGDWGVSRGIFNVDENDVRSHGGPEGAWIWAWINLKTFSRLYSRIYSSMKVIKLIHSVRINSLVYL